MSFARRRHGGGPDYVPEHVDQKRARGRHKLDFSLPYGQQDTSLVVMHYQGIGSFALREHEHRRSNLGEVSRVGTPKRVTLYVYD